MALGVAASHKEQLFLPFSWLLVPFTVAFVMCQRNAKPGAGPSAKKGVGSSIQKPSHQNAPLQVTTGLTHDGGSQAAFHKLGLTAHGQLMSHPKLASG